MDLSTGGKVQFRNYKRNNQMVHIKEKLANNLHFHLILNFHKGKNLSPHPHPRQKIMSFKSRTHFGRTLVSGLEKVTKPTSLSKMVGKIWQCNTHLKLLEYIVLLWKCKLILPTLSFNWALSGWSKLSLSTSMVFNINSLFVFIVPTLLNNASSIGDKPSC